MRRIILGIGLLLIGIGWAAFRSGDSLHGRTASAARETVQAAEQRPIEEDVHEFMEYINGPVFARLRKLLAEEPKGRPEWRQARGYALVLGETGNLLMIRPPEEDEAAGWKRFSAALRDEGAKLYEATKKRDYKIAREHYIALARQCNTCHNEFSDGEPVIEP